MNANLLDRETSPYLLQHKDNPVHWQAWGGAALALAKRENKPILLSVGYAACHWCHVMAHESFEDPETAALMNAHFVNVKVDREERPDIDAIYQSALALLGQHGGWPLTMFLTPDGEPFWGGTYFPPENRFGRPSFRDVLRRLHQVYTGDPDAVAKNRGALREALDKLSEPPPDAPAVSLSLELLDAVAAQLAGEIDPRHGGLGGAPKFPHVPAFELLWRAYLRGGPAACRDAVTLTLDRMCQGGIYDHLGGGFARYATDQAWLVPHFEKMLYDNAQLLDLLTLVWQHQRSPLYAQRARETAEWVLREMGAEGGGFAATQDADSEGEEGKFYVWSEAEIDALLGADAGRFKAAYDVTPGGNWEGRTILNRSARPEPLSEAEETGLAALRQVLWQHREGRVKPGWDDKVLADWNGQMIAALANASAAFGEPRWLDAARAAFAFVCEHMSVDGRLRHSCRQGRAQHAALLDDYANMARAALALFEITGVDDYLSRAQAWVEVVESHYRDPRHGGYFYTADDAEGLITRTRSAADNAVPAGNGTLAAVLARLYHLSGDERYRERAAATIAAFAGEVARNFIPLATLLNAHELLEQALQIVIVGGRGEAATEALLGVVHGAALPNRVLLVAGDGTPLPAHHPAHGKGRVGDKPAAYLCVGTTCSLPVSEPEALRAALARRAVEA
jgi:uncharacterized protein YyaL (SSP411 family)